MRITNAHISVRILMKQNYRFVMRGKSNAHGMKFPQLASEIQKRELRRHIQAINCMNSESESIYYSIKTINDAMSYHKENQFKYSEDILYLKETLKGDDEIYALSPYALLWKEDDCYVVGWSIKHENMSLFRVFKSAGRKSQIK